MSTADAPDLLTPQRSAARPSPLRVSGRVEGDRYRLVLHGECDLRAASRLAEAVAEACASGCRQVVVDLESCDFMDTTGVHSLLALTRTLAPQADRDLVVLAGPPQVQRVFEACELLDVLPFGVDEQPGRISA